MELPQDTEILETLGEGNFGVVYVARLREGAIARTVVLKILKDNLIENHEALIRAQDEAALLARLNHAHIVKVERLTTLRGLPTVMMEHVQGLTLDQVLKQQGPLPLSVALDIAARVASALDAAYNRAPPGEAQPLRVIHRDIKPSNIIVSIEGLVKVLDFGAARGDFEDRLANTQNMTIGTQLYMAPEALYPDQVSPALDIYALGATLYELITGLPLGLLSNQRERFARKLDQRLELMRPAELEKSPETLEAVRQTLRAFLAYDPSARPDARATQDACRRLIMRLPSNVPIDWWSETVILPLHTRRERQAPPLDGSLLEPTKNIAKSLPRTPGPSERVAARPEPPDALPGAQRTAKPSKSSNAPPDPASTILLPPKVQPSANLDSRTRVVASRAPKKTSATTPGKPPRRSRMVIAALFVGGLLMGVPATRMLAEALQPSVAPLDETISASPSEAISPEAEVAKAPREPPDEPAAPEEVEQPAHEAGPIPPPIATPKPTRAPTQTESMPRGQPSVPTPPAATPIELKVFLQPRKLGEPVLIDGTTYREGEMLTISVGKHTFAYDLRPAGVEFSGACTIQVTALTSSITLGSQDGEALCKSREKP